MKAITLYQPFATMIYDGVKTIETRTHDRFKNLMGQRIGIHAGTKIRPEAIWEYLDSLDEEGRCEEHRRLSRYVRFINYSWPRFSILCTVEVLDFRKLAAEDNEAACCLADGKWGLILGNIERIDPPIFARGHQGAWNFEV